MIRVAQQDLDTTGMKAWSWPCNHNRILSFDILNTCAVDIIPIGLIITEGILPQMPWSIYVIILCISDHTSHSLAYEHGISLHRNQGDLRGNKPLQYTVCAQCVVHVYASVIGSSTPTIQIILLYRVPPPMLRFYCLNVFFLHNNPIGVCDGLVLWVCCLYLLSIM